LDFKIYTNALKAYETGDGERYVSGTTSSTIRDLHGDEMSLDALKSMADTARQNMTVFLNHNYNVPEDLFGSAMDAQIVKRFDEETGQEVYDLDLNIRVVNEDENPEALRAYRAIKRGVKLGLSIGARVEKARRKSADGDKPESILIEKVRLLEASVVGIPANQRSYLQNAVKSLKSGSVDIEELESIIVEEEKANNSFRVGDYVSWSSSGGPAEGKIVKIVRNGKLSVPNSSVTVSAEEGNPAVLIRVYRDGKPSDVLVGHKMSTLRRAKAPASANIDELSLKASEIIDSIKALPIEGETAAAAKPLVDALAKLLADSATLYVKAQGAHWNVVGPDFTQYHELFGEIYDDVYKSLDPIAENIRKLNAPAPAELRELALMASAMPVADDYDPESLASALYAANELVLKSIMNAFAEANRVNEQGIANFLAERQDAHQKWSWQLRSSLAEEEEDTGAGGIDVEDTGEEMDDETEKSAKSSVQFGDFVAWQNTDGPGGYGEVEQVVKEGSVVVPKTNEEVAAVPNDPAILVRIWAQESEGKYKPTGEFLGLLTSMVKKVKGPGEGAEGAPSQTATQIPGLEILPPGKVPGGASSQEKSMDIEEKKTRVTVTVSTDGEEKQPAAASVAPSAPDAAAADSEEKPEEIKASADGEVDGEVTEKVEDEAEVAEEKPVDANIEALQELGAELVTGEAEKSVADESPAQPEMAEAVVNVETEAASFEEVESIAKSALDAANAAQEEVAALAAKVTELFESKAKVEGDLAKALDLIDRISDLGIGRKSVDKSTQRVNVKAAERAPWLSPYVQRVLEAQDEE